MPRRINKRLRRKYRDQKCTEILMFDDNDIIEFLEKDENNFIIEVDGQINCGNKKEMLTRRAIKNVNLVYLCIRPVEFYNITGTDIVDNIPYLRMESVGLSQGQILISYNNIIEVIINSSDQVFVCKRMYDHLGNLLSSKSTVSLSVFINKASVVSAAHCQKDGNYPIYSVYSVTHPDERDKLKQDFIIPRSIHNKDINEIRIEIDNKLGLDKDELVEVYFPEDWSMIISGSNIPDYGLSEAPDSWWNIKDGGTYKLQNDLIEIDEDIEANNEFLIMRFLEDMYRDGKTTIEDIRETLENQIQRPDELPETIDIFIQRLESGEQSPIVGAQDLDTGFIDSPSGLVIGEEEGLVILPETLIHDGEEVKVDVYTHNGTNPLPRYAHMIFMIDEDINLSHVMHSGTAEMEPIYVSLRTFEGGIMSVGTFEYTPSWQDVARGPADRAEIRLYEPVEGEENIEDAPEFQPPVESSGASTPHISPRRLDFDEELSDEQLKIEENYSNLDFVLQNSHRYGNILFNDYYKDSMFAMEDLTTQNLNIRSRFRVFKFIMSRLSDIHQVYYPPSLPERSSVDFSTELTKLDAELKTFEDKLIEIDDRDRLVLLRFNRALKNLLTDRGVVHAAVYDYI